MYLFGGICRYHSPFLIRMCSFFDYRDALDGPELVQLQQQLEAAIAAGLVDPNAVDGGGGDGGGGGGAGEPRGSRSVSTSSSVASCSSDGNGGVDGLVAQLMAMVRAWGFDFFFVGLF